MNRWQYFWQTAWNQKGVAYGLAAGAILTLFFAVTTNFAMLRGNYGSTLTNSILLAQVFTIILVVANVAMITSKPSKSGAATGASGTFLAILVSGCGACSITLAGALGLGALLVFLPLHGLEIKIPAIILLVVSLFIMSNPTPACKVTSSKS